MQTKFEKLSATNATLIVEINEDDYKAPVDKKIKEYAKTAVVKGFRPGHVPIQYIKNIYGKGVLVDEVIKIASDAVNKSIAENNLNVVGEPMPKEDAYKIDWAKQKEYTFEYELGFASDFTVDLSNIPPVVQYQIEPTEDTLNETIEDLKNRFSVETNPEDAEIGDIVFGVLKQESSEFSNTSGIPTDKVKEESQYLFKGLEVGSSVKFDIANIFSSIKELGFATGKSDEEAEKLSGEFEFTVDKIVRNTPSEINQEFFDKVLGIGKVENEEDFRLEVKNIIVSNYQRESEYLLNLDMQNALLQHVPIELPNEFLKKWLLELNEGKATAEDIDREFEAIIKDLKLDLLNTDLAKKYDLKIQKNDVLEVYKSEIRGYFGGQGSFDGMEDFIHTMAEKQYEENKSNENGRKYFQKAFNFKVLSLLQENMAKELKTVNSEEFKEIIQNRGLQA
jgi:trigger factor